jgi:hypothetical protein
VAGLRIIVTNNFALRRNKNKHKARNNQNGLKGKWSSARFIVTSWDHFLFSFPFLSFRRIQDSASDFIRGFAEAAVHRRTRLKDRKGKEYETTLATQHESVTEFGGFFQGRIWRGFWKQFVSFSCMRAWHWGFLYFRRGVLLCEDRGLVGLEMSPF